MCEKVVEGVETLSESEGLIARSVDGTSTEKKIVNPNPSFYFN